MEAMRRVFGVLTGYSDHTLGDHVSLAAAALGACMLEKHFTLDRKLPGPDHAFAMEPAELKEMMRKLREIGTAVGDGVKDGPRPEEKEMYEKGRRSLHAARDIPRRREDRAGRYRRETPRTGNQPAPARPGRRSYRARRYSCRSLDNLGSVGLRRYTERGHR